MANMENSRPSRVLVTGGAGFIGSHTVEMLLERSIPVRVLDNLSSGKLDNLPSHPLLDFRQGDIRDSGDVFDAMQGISHVLHLAAQVSVQASVENPLNSCANNILGFVNLIDTASKSGVKRFVYASSAATYGASDHLPLHESAQLRPQSPYGLEKMADEQYASLFAGLRGISAMGLRYFNVFGPRQDPASPYAGVISIFIEQALRHQPVTVFGDGFQSRDFIFVRDVARANIAALTSTGEGACNVATGLPVTLRDLLVTIQQLFGYPLVINYRPARKGDIQHSTASVQRMRESLAIEPETTLGEGLQALISSYRTEEQVKSIYL